MAKAKAKTRPRSRVRTKVRSTRRGAAAKKRTQSRPHHNFTVSHRREEDFKAGLRSYATYRDFGMSDATAGMVQAHVIRMIPPCDPKEVSKLHFHDVDFQMVYVLKGWMKSEFEGQGAVLMQEGSAWIQPPRIKHKVLDYSDDCELLEIILPAKFETVALE